MSSSDESGGEGLPAPRPVPRPAVPAEMEAALGAASRVLISDADRGRVADALGNAFAEGRLTREEYDERLSVALGARTVTDLLPVVEGLPPAAAAAALAPLLPTGAAAPAQQTRPDVNAWYRPGENTGNSTAVAIFGGATRKGEWTVPPELTAVAVFGGVELDLTRSTFAAGEAEITAVAVMGGVDITVPEGVTVQINGIGIFGGFDQRAEGPGDPGAPVIRIKGAALFGGVSVKRKRRKGSGGRAIPGSDDPRQIGGPERPELT